VQPATCNLQPATSKARVTAVTKRSSLRVLATAPGHRLGFGNLSFRRPQASALVGAVAEGLGLGTPAGAPPVSARRNFLHNRRFLKDDWFTHNRYLV
jgi:hypothetical protein